MTEGLALRTALERDLDALRKLIELAISRLQDAFLTPAQVVASRQIMGLDTQLVEDGSYFIVEDAGIIVGCGGWSRRATLYGGDHSRELRNPVLLDPSKDPARIRAMYTHPDHARRGIGRMLLDRCERAAAAEGFASVELMATMSGRPLYVACGYEAAEDCPVDVAGVIVPMTRMRKRLANAAA
ncbi:GNAT family N-acetyltransferase [Sphingomonas nostoxanthinifaciens]|nr:GNAT family N-acetyltransferase [Sphingomonas nostoxanthinifaciens]